MDSPIVRRRLPPLNALRAFDSAARHLSFTRASEELHVTQAAVSHQVKTLEDWLGLPLFRRRNRQVWLTEAGQRYLPPIRAALDSIDLATRELQRQDKAGALTVSTLGSFAAYWLVPRLGDFRRRHPDIDVRISATDEQVDFARDDVDLAIRYGSGGWPGVKAERLLTEDMFPVCSPALLRGAHPLRTPQDLKHHTLLHDDMRVDWRLWLMAAGVEGIDTSRGTTFNLSNLVIQAAIQGEGVALGRSALVANEIREGRLVRPFDIQLSAQFAYFIVTPEQGAERPKVKAFIEWLREQAAISETELSGIRSAVPADP